MPRSTVSRAAILASLAMLLVGFASQLQAQSAFNTDARDFQVLIERQLLDRKYAELEETAARLRRERPTFLTGRSQLLDFYEGLTEATDKDGRRDQRLVDDRIQQIEAWHAAQPTATTRLALATALRVAAWTARGTGFADTVTPGSERRMEESLGRAEELLQEAEPDLKGPQGGDAFFYFTWMGVGVLKGYPEARMRELLERALACDPWFTAAIDVMCNHSLPRWYGEEGDLLRLADDLAAQMRDKTGETAYAVVAVTAFHMGEIQEFSDDGFQWPRVRQGLRDWIKPVPDSPFRWGLLAEMAHRAGDRPTALEAIEQLHGRWHTAVFTRRVDYLRTERWARAAPSPADGPLVVEIGPKPVLDVVFVKEGKAFVPAAWSRKLQVHSADDGSILDSIDLDVGNIEHVDSDAEGRLVVCTSPEYRETTVSVVDLETGEQAVIGSQAGRILALTLSRNQQYIVMGNDRGDLRRWENAGRPIPLEWPTGLGERINGLAMAPDGQSLVSVGAREATLWNLGTREKLRTWEVHGSRVGAVAWSPTETIIATAGRSNEIKLWSTDESRELAALIGGNTSIQSLAFTPDGKHLVAATMSVEQPQIPGEVTVWNMETRKPVKTYTGHRLGIWKVAVSPDGQKIASASEDGTVRVWPVPMD